MSQIPFREKKDLQMLLGGQWETPSIARKIFIKKKKRSILGVLKHLVSACGLDIQSSVIAIGSIALYNTLLF